VVKLGYLTESSQALRLTPHEDRVRCTTVCRFLLVELEEDRRTWRCEYCLRYLEVKVAESIGQGSLF
jgi:hypothetical protein